MLKDAQIAGKHILLCMSMTMFTEDTVMWIRQETVHKVSALTSSRGRETHPIHWGLERKKSGGRGFHFVLLDISGLPTLELPQTSTPYLLTLWLSNLHRLALFHHTEYVPKSPACRWQRVIFHSFYNHTSQFQLCVCVFGFCSCVCVCFPGFLENHNICRKCYSLSLFAYIFRALKWR
jgi:hypothetical protein